MYVSGVVLCFSLRVHIRFEHGEKVCLAPEYEKKDATLP
jgi:hypothetical protein